MLGRGKLSLAFAIGQLVQAFGEALSGSAGVDEDDRRVVFLDQLEELGVDGGPDRADVGERLALGRNPLRVGEVGRPGLGHVVDRHDDLQIQLLRDPRIHDLALRLGPHEKLRDPLQRPLRRREPDALDPGVGGGLGGASPLLLRRVLPRAPGPSARAAPGDSARCEPRLDWATAWISSTITVSTVEKISRTEEESIR